MVIKATDNDISLIALVEEGQGWKRIALDDFVRGSFVVEQQVAQKHPLNACRNIYAYR
jgi:hypothetical protein